MESDYKVWSEQTLYIASQALELLVLSEAEKEKMHAPNVLPMSPANESVENPRSSFGLLRL